MATSNIPSAFSSATDVTAYSSASDVTVFDHSVTTSKLSLAEKGVPVDEAHQTLPPTDGGRAAWVVLACCSIIQAPIWGFSLIFGVMKQYYAVSEVINGEEQSFTVIGTTNTGLLFLLMPFTFFILTRYPFLRSYSAAAGLVISTTAYLISSFSTEIWHLILTQGIVAGIGGALMFAPCGLLVDQWFVRRRGLAYALMWSGKDISGIALPFIFRELLERFGIKVTLLVWAAAVLVITTPVLFFLRPRVPVKISDSVQPMNIEFLRRPSFWMLQIGNIFQSLGFYLPQAYLPTYAIEMVNATSAVSTLILVLFNGSSAAGGILVGTLCDLVYVNFVVLLLAFGSAIAIFIFWGLSETLPLLIMFAILYGFCAGSFSSTWGGAIKQLKEQSPDADSGLMFGVLASGRGVGFVVSGPLTVALMTTGVNMGDKFGYGSRYGAMIVFTGITAILGGWGFLSRKSLKLRY